MRMERGQGGIRERYCKPRGNFTHRSEHFGCKDQDGAVLKWQPPRLALLKASLLLGAAEGVAAQKAADTLKQ